MQKIDQAILDQIELEYRAGVKSVNSIAKLHGLPEPTLRRMAKKNGWIRGAAEIKRRVVEDHFAGVTKGVTNDEVRQNQQQGWSRDPSSTKRAIVMPTSLAVRKAVRKRVRSAHSIRSLMRLKTTLPTWSAACGSTGTACSIWKLRPRVLVSPG